MTLRAISDLTKFKLEVSRVKRCAGELKPNSDFEARYRRLARPVDYMMARRGTRAALQEEGV